MTRDQYYELEQITDAAEDKLISGEGEIGQHYTLAWILRGYGVFSFGRDDTVKQARKLLEQNKAVLA